MKPCERCGGEKTPGPGRFYCAPCRATVKAEREKRRCRTCRTLSPPGGFKDAAARRCLDCQRTLPIRRCPVCDGHVGHFEADVVTCKSVECVARARTFGVHAMKRLAMKATARRTAKRCPQCGVTKPLTAEHWPPGASRWPSDKYGTYCRPCRRAVDADRRRRRLGLAPAIREVASSTEGRSDAALFPSLPAAQLHETVVRAARGHEHGLGGFCAMTGINDKNVREWHPVTGEREAVSFDVADRVLIALGLCWWDVWEPGTPGGRLAQRAFEGDTDAVA